MSVYFSLTVDTPALTGKGSVMAERDKHLVNRSDYVTPQGQADPTPPDLETRILSVLVVAAATILFIVFMWFYASPFLRNIRKNRVCLVSKNEAHFQKTRAATAHRMSRSTRPSPLASRVHPEKSTVPPKRSGNSTKAGATHSLLDPYVYHLAPPPPRTALPALPRRIYQLRDNHPQVVGAQYVPSSSSAQSNASLVRFARQGPFIGLPPLPTLAPIVILSRSQESISDGELLVSPDTPTNRSPCARHAENGCRPVALGESSSSAFPQAGDFDVVDCGKTLKTASEVQADGPASYSTFRHFITPPTDYAWGETGKEEVAPNVTEHVKALPEHDKETVVITVAQEERVAAGEDFLSLTPTQSRHVASIGSTGNTDAPPVEVYMSSENVPRSLFEEAMNFFRVGVRAGSCKEEMKRRDMRLFLAECQGLDLRTVLGRRNSWDTDTENGRLPSSNSGRPSFLENPEAS